VNKTGSVNEPIIVERHRDGKLYPLDWHDPVPEHSQRLRDLAHHLRCVERLSYPKVQAAMLERYGERRSIGRIWRDVHEYECGHCVPELTPPQPDSNQRPRAFAWR
jgi:hypothetical protein